MRMVYFIEAGETCYVYDPVGNLTKQTLRDLPSALGLTKTLLHDVFSPRHSANTG